MDEQVEVISNLPPFTISEINDAISQASRDGSTVSLVSSSSSEDDTIVNCFTSEDAQPTINIINSSDVVIGTVTQFHGPVTIVQHTPGSENDLKAIASSSDDSKKANLVTTEVIDTTIKPSVKLNCVSTRVLIKILFVIIAVIAVALTLIFTINPSDFDEDSTESTDGNGGRDPDGQSTQYNITGHEYYTRSHWGGRAPLWVDEIKGQVRWVIVSHTVTSQCKTFGDCSNLMRLMQDIHVNAGSPNIGYNFVIGGDGNVYEGRGWFAQNFHFFDKNSLAISFIGNYVYDELTNDMVDLFVKVLNLGVELRAIHPNYRLIAHNQTLATLSPGVNIYKVLKTMSNFYVDLRPRDARTADNDDDD